MIDLAALMLSCQLTMNAGMGNLLGHVVTAESAANPFAIGTVPALERQPATLEEAVATARALAAAGRRYDAGLAQISSANFTWLELTLEQAFDPCTNLAAGARVLAHCYERARATHDGQAAVTAALSCYNTGNFEAGVANGYVQRVSGAKPPTKPRSVLDEMLASGIK